MTNSSTKGNSNSVVEVTVHFRDDEGVVEFVTTSKLVEETSSNLCLAMQNHAPLVYICGKTFRTDAILYLEAVDSSGDFVDLSGSSTSLERHTDE